ncbi:MAG: hypothetical protein OXI37_10230 [Gammaproteobacteria bacterium]|nr:hypothetical protein [Gammaproteobacteria bacterium]
MVKIQEIQIGALIIGSLYWHDSELRSEWRREHLRLEAKQLVKAPIRYGRRSKGWGMSYTMVFSMNLVSENLYGRAIFVPYNKPVYNFEDLVRRAKQLWAAESNNEHSTHISARNGWGRVALLENQNHPMPYEFRTNWAKYVAAEVGYSKIDTAVGEEKVVDKSGFLRIPWPKFNSSSDLKANALLTAVTNPTTNKNRQYPSSKEIADAWKNSDDEQHVDYFRKNRLHGIETFQDIEIQDELQDLLK